MKKCSTSVWRDDFHTGQCSKQATVTRDGKAYCAIHDPEYIKEKEISQKAKYDANSCKCGYHFPKDLYSYCPLCGTKRSRKP